MHIERGPHVLPKEQDYRSSKGYPYTGEVTAAAQACTRLGLDVCDDGLESLD